MGTALSFAPFRLLLFLSLLALMAFSIPSPPSASAHGPLPATRKRALTYAVKHRHPHDPSSFTQGLVASPNRSSLFESTGLYGRSKVREVDIASGEVLEEFSLRSSEFGEGLALFNRSLYQLLYQTNRGRVYSPTHLTPLREFNTPLRTGWGLCPSADGRHLAASDGSERVYFLDPETLNERSRITVRDKNTSVKLVNELELVNGEIWANVWFTECIARIDPNSGSINGWILLQGLKSEQEQTREPKMGRVDVLNGIAYEDESNRIFVTGKLWHTLYEIEIREPDEMLGKGMETRSMCIPKQG